MSGAHTAAGGDAHVFTVSELNRTVRELLEAGLGAIWIEGELSNIARPASGHVYFSLKDRDAQVRCAMFRSRNRLLDFTAEAGDRVRARARVSVYEARGDYQLIVEHMEPAGAGDLARAFEQLRQRLLAEGLFAAERKRTPPTLPRRIGVVTSATGAALRDVLQVLQRRLAAIPVIVYPVAVQGSRAAAGIVAMLERAARRGECDLLLLVRGGGSLEDLQAFNEEAVARAIVACPIPVITGVGHEVDVTIADLAADRRAPTPSAAAELAVPDARDLLRNAGGARQRLTLALRARLRQLDRHCQTVTHRLRQQHPARRLQQLQQRRDEMELALVRNTGRILQGRNQRLASARRRLRQATPGRVVRQFDQRLAHLRGRLRQAGTTRLAALDARIGTLARALDAVSPLNTLGRGYALVCRESDGRPLTDAARVAAGDALDIRLAHGRLAARVEGRQMNARDTGDTGDEP